MINTLNEAQAELTGIVTEIQSALAEVRTAKTCETVTDFECEVASAIISLEQAVRDLKEIALIRRK